MKVPDNSRSTCDSGQYEWVNVNTRHKSYISNTNHKGIIAKRLDEKTHWFQLIYSLSLCGGVLYSFHSALSGGNHTEFRSWGFLRFLPLSVLKFGLWVVSDDIVGSELGKFDF